MKNKKVWIISIVIITILIVLGFIANYVDKGRVSTGHEPKFTIKITTDGGNKITYWGLGYKIVRYSSVSPNEPFKNSLGTKMGSWFMKYELSKYESIDVELLTEGKTGVCVGVKGETLTYMDINEANKLPKKKPVQLIEQAKHFI